MRRLLAITLPFTLAMLLLGCGTKPAETGEEAAPAEAAPAPTAHRAVAYIEAKSGSSVGGAATFTAKDGTVTMALSVTGAEPGAHAVHLHEIGDCSAEDGSSAGGHWNPTDADHGKWGEESYHRGDVGNLEVMDDGTGKLTLESAEWTIGGDPATDIVGRAVVVHAKADDFETQPTGAAGGRVGCGVIESAGGA